MWTSPRTERSGAIMEGGYDCSEAEAHFEISATGVLGVYAWRQEETGDSMRAFRSRRVA